MNSTVYDKDFVQWTAETARLLRERRFDQIDVEHIAEEIEDMGKRDRRELISRLTVLVSHLLKWKCQSHRRSHSWQTTATNQRIKLQVLFRDSPSLKASLSRSIEEVYPDAVRRAMSETDLPASAFPQHCAFTSAQLLDPDYLPD
jgi:uncharacterized protein DUF29